MNRIPYKKRGPKIVVKVIYVSYKDGNKNFNAKKKKSIYYVTANSIYL